MLYAEQKILHVFVAFIEYFLYYSCMEFTLSYVTLTMMPKSWYCYKISFIFIKEDIVSKELSNLSQSFFAYWTDMFLFR